LRRRPAAAVAVLGGALLLASPALAEIYRYVDDEGNSHIVTHPSQIPARFRSDAKRSGSAPTSPTKPTEGAALSAAPGPPSTGGAAPASQAVVIRPLDASAGHVVLEAVVNGSVRQRMIVDTGASVTVLPMSAAPRLGMSLRPPYASIAVQTASGTEVFPIARIRSIGAADAVVRDLPVVFNPNMEVGLLGVDFLGEFEYAFTSDTLTLAPRDTTPREGVYGGRPSDWWRDHFDSAQGNVRRLRELRAEFRKTTAGEDKNAVQVSGPFRGFTLREVLSSLDMSMRFWEQELKALERKAGEADVPYDLR
ncbi:MAG: retroviral-like aspartic protease family protein, partial [Caldilineaceae bacterium]|nr:retroviral-like aspartic protease family protein [Caldilineaceae bacterium]